MTHPRHGITSDSRLTPEAQAFIDEWTDGNGFVKAHTSGSTGTPKEIILSKADMRASARATNRFFNIGPGSTLLLPLSPDYIAGKMQITRAMEAGCRLVVTRPSSRPFQDYSGECTMIPIVPSQIDGLLNAPFINRVGHIIIGGAPLSPVQEQTLLNANIDAYVTYGMTETCSHVALRRVGEKNYRGLPGFTFTQDSRGCLVIESDTMSFGQLTTNDVARLHDNHNFEWLGRYDNVINSGGVKIHPEVIERAMSGMLPRGTTAYITSRVSDRWGEEAVIVTDNPNLDIGIIDTLKTLLPSHHAPRDIIYLPDIPHTSSGKIIRQKF